MSTGTSSPLRSGIDLADGRPEVRPQDDLFRFVNGRWLDDVAIPDDRASAGTFYDLHDEAEAHLRRLVETLATSPAAEGTDERKVGDLYASFLDVETIERLGTTPLAGDLAAIEAVTSTSELARLLGALQRKGVTGAVAAYVNTDAKRSDRYVVHLSQAGLGLPDESYYRDESFEPVRTAYREHLVRMLALAGLDDPEGRAARTYALEERLAGVHWDRVSARDAVKSYTLVERAGLAELAPAYDWAAWLEGLEAPESALAEVVVRQPSFLAGLSAALVEVPLRDWQDWAAWRLLRASAPLLPEALAAESFAFYGTTLTGAPEQRERWKRGIDVVESALGEALGRRYVADHFPPRSKELMLELVGNLVEAYREDITALDWMSPETKARALEKLDAFTPKIGYPDEWRDYSALEVRRDDLVGNVQRADAFELDRDLAKLGGPVDRGEWFMTPQTINAYYNPGMNEIVFPAAILQPPFFDPDADAAVNYGGIGAVIGHEIGHGFDDQGSKYDGAGNLHDWWTDADRAAFDERAAALIAQFDALEPAQTPGQHVNGALTVGENIGDLGGLTVAYKAYELSLGGAEPPVIDGLTGWQRFFISWARIWRGKGRDADVARRLAVDPHSPTEFRCNAVVRNLDEFHAAFGTATSDGLWLEPADRVRIW
ncbi:putative endopeptidase [Motilibacter rhizosphaerae]|uniref:Putative endopeptidase n=1 Tax=Motilibacter rhizosphaerae TaxID=598652 RepID=A0A4Q7NRL7_9ACTN|nr:M13-type metalloendopeptidase [Motilibacter rhizosphaerae]RZS89733.1 putative endopeptidase [Motilibacter rhizosphaerae]